MTTAHEQGSATATGFDAHAGTRGAPLSGGWFADGAMTVMDRLMATRVVRKLFGAFGFHAVVLTTIGRRSGARRRRVVLWLPGPDGGGLVVAAAGGTASNPAWYYNIAAHPDQIEVEIDGRPVPMRAEQLHGEERAEAWRRFTDKAPWFIGFQEKTDRELPVIRLVPRSEVAQ